MLELDIPLAVYFSQERSRAVGDIFKVLETRLSELCYVMIEVIRKCVFVITRNRDMQIGRLRFHGSWNDKPKIGIPT